MAKIPRVSGNVLIKYLITKGFLPTSRNGSHVSLKNKNIFVTVPAKNSEIRIGLLLDILGSANISREEYINDYNKKIIK